MEVRRRDEQARRACRSARTPRAWSTTRPLLAKAGVPEPTDRHELGRAHRLGDRPPERAKIPGTQDPSADYKAFWVWLRQQGKDLYDGTSSASPQRT